MALTDRQKQQLREAMHGAVRFDEPMRAHTTIQVGGPADAWIEPTDLADLMAAVRWAEGTGVPWICVGRGSNLLVRDGGVRGLAIHLGAMARMQLIDNRPRSDPQRVGAEPPMLIVEAGVKLKRLLGFCGEHGVSGLEGLEGVPGTVGGAIVMNAGTPAGCIGDAVIDVRTLEKGGTLVTRTKEQLAFGYRKVKLPRNAVVVSARLGVASSTPAAVRATLQTLRTKRHIAQPGTEASLGSVFKNPGATSAWRLVEEAGLRGVRVGGARVSAMHANWIVNEGGATAKDVEVLIRLMRERVKEARDILLEPEVVIVGEEK